MTDTKLNQVSADDGCFVCGSQNKIGLQAPFETDVATATSRAAVVLPEELQGWQGVIHGGIVAALLDEACIYACRAKAEQCVTAELQVRYRKPVPVGARVEVSGVLQDASRKIWHASARLEIAGTLHAEASAKIIVLEKN